MKTCYHLNSSFFNCYLLEFTNSLNQREKQELIIKLRKDGKTYREIAHIAGVSLRDIKPTLKKYERKLQTKKGEENNQKTTKKLSLSSRAFKLFSDGKKPTEVVIELDIPPEKVEKLWSQFLKSERMEECYDFFQQCQYDIPTILSIKNFIKRNNISGNNIANVLREANDVNNLNKAYYNLKTEIKYLEQKKMYLQNYSNSPYSLQPLPLNKQNYNYYRY
jgi:uncharacterized protein YerC